jgi:Protein of unknown function (DUF3617)
MKTMLVLAATALLLLIGTAYAADLPELKEGLWSVHKQTTTNPENSKSDTTSTICRNHAYDQHVRSLMKSMKGCSVVSESLQGGTYVLETRCEITGTMVDSKGTVTSQGDNATHSETHATYTPAMAGISEMTIIMDQKYVGSCPAGVQPGDITQADGRVSHTWKH